MESSTNEVVHQESLPLPENGSMEAPLNEPVLENEALNDSTVSEKSHVKPANRTRRYRMYSNRSCDGDMPHTTTSF